MKYLFGSVSMLIMKFYIFILILILDMNMESKYLQLLRYCIMLESPVLAL